MCLCAAGNSHRMRSRSFERWHLSAFATATTGHRAGHTQAHCSMQAVKSDYYFQMFYDDLPIWGFIGKLEKVSKPSGIELRYFIFTHVHFDVAYNTDHIVEINVSTDPNQVVDISEDIVGASPDATIPAEFTYSAKWRETEVTYDKRMDQYRRNQFLPQHLEVCVIHQTCLPCFLAPSTAQSVRCLAPCNYVDHDILFS